MAWHANRTAAASSDLTPLHSRIFCTLICHRKCFDFLSRSLLLLCQSGYFSKKSTKRVDNHLHLFKTSSARFFSNKMICVIRVRIHKGILMRSTPKNGSNYIDEAFIWNWDYFDGQELFLSFFKGQECMEWLRIFKLDFFLINFLRTLILNAGLFWRMW